MTLPSNMVERLREDARQMRATGLLADGQSPLAEQAATLITTLSEELEAVKEALKPFAAEAHDNWSAAVLENEIPLRIILPSGNEYKARFSMADISRLAALLRSIQGEK